MASISEDCCLYCCGRCQALFPGLDQFLQHKAVCDGTAPTDGHVAVRNGTASADAVVCNGATAMDDGFGITSPEEIVHVQGDLPLENAKELEVELIVKKPRGRKRPRKDITTESNQDKANLEGLNRGKTKRGRGRPRKYPSGNANPREVDLTRGSDTGITTFILPRKPENLQDAVVEENIAEGVNEAVHLSDFDLGQNVETIEITVADDGQVGVDQVSDDIILHVPNSDDSVQVEIPTLDHEERIRQSQSGARYSPKNDAPKPNDYHVLKEGRLEILHCNYCKYKTKHLHMLGRHLTGHNEGGRPFACDQCSFTCMFRGLFLSHVKKHTRSIACDKCSYRTNNQRDLKRHQLRHTGEFPFSCFVCSQLFRQKHGLEIHMRIHTGELYKCDIEGCTYETPNKNTLKGHQSRKHGLGAPKYVCEAEGCSYVGVDITSFQYHMKAHLGLKDHQCPYCDFSAVTTGSVKRHMKLHLSEKFYQCDRCSFETSHQSALRVHLMEHEGLKPYSCGYPACGYKASTKSRVQHHLESLHPDEETAVLYDGTNLKIDFDSFRNKNISNLDKNIRRIRFVTNENDAITIDEDSGVGTVSRIKRIVAESSELMGASTADCFQCDLCKFQCRSASSLATHRITCHEDSIRAMDSTNQSSPILVEGGVISALATVQAQMDVETCS